MLRNWNIADETYSNTGMEKPYFIIEVSDLLIKDQEQFEKEYIDLVFGWNDLKDFSIETQAMKEIRTKIEKSWECIFDLEREDKNLIYGSNSKKSIQATCWELKLEQVIKAEVFIAK
ncbi:DUF3841 domain-containing protein [Xylanivirga thermophila]|uniref:DUF3841 domain-containing protein n=1 Tax=Xylanivirga thermophila TaxID=2496273 RepID=UPI00101C7B61|nr:DUF3841 domain-containing protein [Xylanivirga thermophila]